MALIWPKIYLTIDSCKAEDDDDSRALFLERKKKMAFGQMMVKFGVFTVLLDTRCFDQKLV